MRSSWSLTMAWEGAASRPRFEVQLGRIVSPSEGRPGNAGLAGRAMERIKAYRGTPKLRGESAFAENGIFGRFGDPEFDHALGRNLDRFAGLWIATHAGFPVR
jgi:hypothetical protein